MSVNPENPITNPYDFLRKPFSGHIELASLASPLGVDLLRFLPTLPDEMGLFFSEGQWTIVKASKIGIPAWAMPDYADVLIHAHYPDSNSVADSSLPSPRDFLNCSSTANNWITSYWGGLTQYWRVTEKDARRVLDQEINGYGEIPTIEEYLKFLKKIDARYRIYPWEEIKEEQLIPLLSQSSTRTSK